MMHTPLLIVLIGLIVLPATASAADITWKLFLKHGVQPLTSMVTREGEEFLIPRVSLSGTDSRAQGIVDALENVSFLISRVPDSRPLEIRVILNLDGSAFELPGGKNVFLNLTLEAYINGRREDPFRFPSGSPMEILIPVEGLNPLLSRCGFSRSDDLVLAFISGSGFTRDDIVTSNRTSGLQAKISHLSTIVGSRCDILNLKPSPSLSPWHQVKLLFR